MPRSSKRNWIRGYLFAASAFFAPVLSANIFTHSPLIPPSNTVYNVPNTCISVVCLQNITLSGFVTFQSGITGGNQLTKSNVTLAANLYQNISGTPGAFINPVQLTGEADITYFSKSSLTQLGIFDAQLTSLDLSGTFAGLTGPHTITAMLNPAQQTLGKSSIMELPPTGGPTTYTFSSFFDVFAELSIDGGPFVPGPERDVTTTPEPGYYALTGCFLVALFMGRIFARRRPRAQAPAEN